MRPSFRLTFQCICLCELFCTSSVFAYRCYSRSAYCLLYYGPVSYFLTCSVYACELFCLSAMFAYLCYSSYLMFTVLTERFLTSRLAICSFEFLTDASDYQFIAVITPQPQYDYARPNAADYDDGFESKFLESPEA